MIALALPAALLQAAVAPAPVLAPVLDRPYRLLTSQRHRIGDTEHRFATERRLVFRREPGGGIVAEMLLVDVSTDLTGAGARRFADTVGALRGEMVRIHLAGDGTVTGIDDEERLRATLAARVAALAANAPGPPPPIDRAALAAPLLAVLTATIPPSGSRPVTLPSRSAGGTALAGTETVLPMAAGRVRIVTHAAGTTGDANVTIERERVLDAAAGLVTEQRETQVTRLGDRMLTIADETLLVAPVR